ncbi:DUF1716-domain-containing protein [Piromyces finnis]|uniref:DUF1716-domain-containing protein n=1 Tax=Piromyces finnis TaxID=1754191 RepID=A0A1Y1V3Y9_9FUNG|nr:DUF1716-domain-containing protein [Piromyces finnis]|eukprot:ORX46686.1 DUF1716-domain-containing protein [Piromyces finnis]
MDINSLFKTPGNTSISKRKLGTLSDSKIMKHFYHDSGSIEDFEIGGPSSKRKKVTEEEVEQEDESFYADGLTEQQREIYDIIDQVEDEPNTIDINTFKKMILKFEKVLSKNQQLRMKYADDPLKFMDSEADLDEEIKHMMSASTTPQFYPKLIELDTVKSILSLLTHENTDISIACIDLINELTDEDVLGEIDEEGEAGLRALVNHMVEQQTFELLVSNLNRLKETQDEDKQGVFNTLSIFENFISIEPKLAETLVEKTNILEWIINRISKKEFDSNKQYCSEILAILLQNSSANRIKFCELDGVICLLKALSVYKRRDPEDSEEIEMMENFFDALCSALIENKVKESFLKDEGIELMLLMIKEKNMSRMRAVKVIDYTLTGDTTMYCEYFIEIHGLKSLFAAFMGKGVKKMKKSYDKQYSESEEIERLVSKFVENDFEKIARMIELYLQYKEKIDKEERAIEKEAEEIIKEYGELSEEDEDMFYLRRMDSGLLTYQLISHIIGHLCIFKEIPIKERIVMLLKRNKLNLEDVKSVIEEYKDNLGDTKDSDIVEKQEIIKILELM